MPPGQGWPRRHSPFAGGFRARGRPAPASAPRPLPGPGSTRRLHPPVEAAAPAQAVREPPRTVRSLAALRDAQRCRVSILFCDLVDSVGLSSRLGDEDYAALLLSYRAACARAVGGAGGMIRYYLGDGVLAYFGCPVAHDDNPVRAVRGGLRLLASLRRLNARLETDRRVALAARAAVHTDLVLAGDFGLGTACERLEVVGEGPNVAVRLHEVARPGTLVLSGETFQAVRRFFDCRPLGPQVLRGLPRPVEAFEVLAGNAAGSTPEWG